MNMIRMITLILAIGVIPMSVAKAADPKPKPKLNVLFIAIDDQNDWLGCLGHPQALTPHIDQLAKHGCLFTNAHCQAPLCNPSRSSLLTGLRPSSTGIYGLAPGIRDVETLAKHVTLPQTFTNAGYHTYTCGKIYHDGSMKPRHQQAEFNRWGPSPGMGKPEKPFARLPAPQHPAMDWGPFPARDEDAADYKIADAAIAAMTSAPKDKPFFIAAGFRLPHVPCFAPQKWFDKFPLDQVQLPTIKENDRDDTPRFSWYLHWKLPEPRLKTMIETKEWKPFVRAYLASTAFMDAQVGRVIEALEKSGRLDETVIVLWSDHGYHLGEKGITGKNTLWERSTRVPLIFAGPGIMAGAKCQQPAELLDIFPTLLDLTGLPARSDLEGLSLTPQLKDPETKRERPAMTTHNQGNHAIRDSRWRYIRYADGSEELYDHKNDPHEWTNLVNDPTHTKEIQRLAQWLPKRDLPPVTGSMHRILTYDPKTKEITWEGKPIKPDDVIPYP